MTLNRDDLYTERMEGYACSTCLVLYATDVAAEACCQPAADPCPCHNGDPAFHTVSHGSAAYAASVIREQEGDNPSQYTEQRLRLADLIDPDVNTTFPKE